ncbi:MAG: hypothetical protein IKP32_06350 [Clostridia bacterium]|nr:hypothetical protein [Clostridia bacterium]
MSEKKPAEKKQHNITSASTGQAMSKEELAAAKKKNAAKAQAAQAAHAADKMQATQLRIFAIILWVIAIVWEVLGILALGKKLGFAANWNPTIVLVVCIILDLVFLYFGSQLWKKANHMDPASEKNKLKFWLWNNLGVIVSILAFVPFIVLIFVNKDTDKNTKLIAGIAAIVALAVGVGGSYDFHPVSQEQVEEMEEVDLIAAENAVELNEGVFWITTGKSDVYHIDQECFTLNNTEDLVYGTVKEAFDAGHTRLCYYCAKRHDVADNVTTEEVAPEEIQEDTTVLEEEETEKTAPGDGAETPDEGTVLDVNDTDTDTAEQPAA